jgi:hypothetical protein
MENIIQEEMSQQEFQFYKDNLKDNVKEYLEIDDQIKALNKAIVERRKQKSKLSADILTMMNKFEIDNMNTKNGRLIYSVSNTSKPLSKKNLVDGLNIYFKNEDTAKSVSQIVLDSRPKVEKITLKRTINKKQQV